MAYAFRPGLAFGGVNPNAAGKELERIRKKYKQLNAKLVVAEAEPEESVLHAAFEWDDSKAANQFRETVARNLIRSVIIVREDNERQPVYVHVRREKRQDNSYEPLKTVVKRKDMLEAALDELRDGIVSCAETMLDVMRYAARSADKTRSKRVGKAKDAIDEAKSCVEAI